MKDRLNKLWNTFPRNPTQTRYLRFLKTPEADVKTSYIKRMEKSLDKDKDRLKTRYTKFFQENQND